MASLSLSFSSSSHFSSSSLTPKTKTLNPKSCNKTLSFSRIFHCRLSSSSSSVHTQRGGTTRPNKHEQHSPPAKKRHWKEGEFPEYLAQKNANSYSCRSSPSSSSPRFSKGNNQNQRSTEKKRHWKEGEFRGISETQFVRSTNRTPLKNLKKKIDNRNNAKAWVNTVTESLADRMHKKLWDEALQVFEMLKQQPFYHPKEGTYMKLLVLLGKSGQPSRAQKLFDEMLEEGLDPTAELYTALLTAYSRSNLLEKAFAVLEEMKGLPLCQPDVYTYSTLIKACIDASRFELVDRLYEEMSERLITPNTVTQNIVLSGYGKAGMFDEMEKVLSGMLESTECIPDVWTMNTVISLFGNKGQIEMMESWYEKFRNFGIEPETRTFNILIGAYGKKQMYDKMSSVMEYMRRLSFPWTTSTYNNVIEAFADAGDAQNMEYTFDQMRAERMKADTKTFCCLIRGYANAGLFHKVVSSIQLAEKLEIPSNTSFFNAVISACAKADDLMEMERVYQRMKDKQCPVNSATFDIMVEAYRKEGMTDKIYDLEQEKSNVLTSGSESE